MAVSAGLLNTHPVAPPPVCASPPASPGAGSGAMGMPMGMRSADQHFIVMVRVQSQEIEQMEQWYRQWYGTADR